MKKEEKRINKKNKKKKQQKKMLVARVFCVEPRRRRTPEVRRPTGKEGEGEERKPTARINIVVHETLLMENPRRRRRGNSVVIFLFFLNSHFVACYS